MESNLKGSFSIFEAVQFIVIAFQALVGRMIIHYCWDKHKHINLL